MYVYLLINFLIIIIGLSCPKQVTFAMGSNEKRSVRVPLQAVLLFTVLFMFMGFRGDFTSDYNSYSMFFERLHTSVSFRDLFTKTFTMEKGFVALSKTISVFTSSKLCYHLIVSFLLLLLYFRIFYKHSEMFWLSILLFVNLGDYYGSMNLVRQSLSAAIMFNGFTLLENKKIIKYSLLVVLAASIHTSALVMTIAYFVLRIDTNKVSRKIYIFASAVAIFILLNYVVNAIKILFPKYQNYHYGMGNGSFNAVVAPLAVYIFLLISLKFFTSDYDHRSVKNIILLNGTLLSVICLAWGTKVYMFTRMVYFFRPYMCLAAPNVLNCYSDKKTKNTVIVIICVIAIAYTQVSLSGTGYDPYYFYRK